MLDTDTYTYGDSNWKDKLTSYNGQTITYDDIGNPLQYRDGMSFTWQAGRQLKSATVNGKTYTRQKTHIRPQQNMNKGRSEWGMFPTRFKFVEIKANTIYNNIGTQLYKSESVSLYYI